MKFLLFNITMYSRLYMVNNVNQLIDNYFNKIKNQQYKAQCKHKFYAYHL